MSTLLLSAPPAQHLICPCLPQGFRVELDGVSAAMQVRQFTCSSRTISTRVPDTFARRRAVLSNMQQHCWCVIRDLSNCPSSMPTHAGITD